MTWLQRLRKARAVNRGEASWTDDLCQRCFSRLHRCVCTRGKPTLWQPAQLPGTAQ